MKNKCKAIFALLLAAGLLLSFPQGVAGALSAEPLQAQAAGSDGTTNWDFIEPVTHLTTVPAGYTAIRTAQDLNNVRNNLSGKYILMNDIDLSSWGNWVPIGSVGELVYTGVFDGNGYKLGNIQIQSLGGLFWKVGGTVKNLWVDVFYNQNSSVDVVIGSLSAYATYATIQNCISSGEVTVTTQRTAKVGGLVGDGGTGGIIRGCKNLCTISVNSSLEASAGGITGRNGYEGVSLCNFADITVVTGSIARVGGITGSGLPKAITKSINYGKLNASSQGVQYIGGISGSGGHISESANTGSIDATTPDTIYCGGIQGNAYSSIITDCYNIGNINASGRLITVKSGSTVIAEYIAVGGVAGEYVFKMERCYNVGKVSGNGLVGALLGHNTAGNALLTGQTGYSFLNNYYIDYGIGAIGYPSGSSASSYALSDAQMRNQSSFINYNFDKIWTMPSGGGYPVLRELQSSQTQIPVTGITLDNASISLYMNSGAMLYATVLPENATNKSVTWTSSKPEVATVEKGAVTAKGSGVTTITATTVDGGFQASCEVEVDIYNIGEETYSFKNYNFTSCSNGKCKERGHCFGMSSTSSAYHLRLLDIGIAGGNYTDDTYALNSTSTVKAPICYYQKRQGSSALHAIVAGGNWYKTDAATKGRNAVTNINSDWTEVINYVKSHAYDDRGSLQISYRRTSQGGHAINFLRYSEVGGQPRVYAYDNNFPNDEIYFYKDTNGNICQAPKSTFSGPIDCIALRSVSTYFSFVGGFDMTHVIYAERDVITVDGADVYAMDGDVELGEQVMFEIPVQFKQVTIIPLVDNASFEYLDDTYSFGEISDSTIGVLTLATIGNNPFLSIDKDGDGTIDEIISFDNNTTPLTITGPTTVDYKGTITLTADKPVNFTTDSKYITLEKVDSQTVKVTSTKSFIKTGSAEIKATPIGGGEATTVTVKVKPTFIQWLMIIILFGWLWM